MSELTFVPKFGQKYFYLTNRFACGYSSTMREPLCAQDDRNIKNGAYRTEVDAKLAVAALGLPVEAA